MMYQRVTNAVNIQACLVVCSVQFNMDICLPIFTTTLSGSHDCAVLNYQPQTVLSSSVLRSQQKHGYLSIQYIDDVCLLVCLMQSVYIVCTFICTVRPCLKVYLLILSILNVCKLIPIQVTHHYSKPGVTAVEVLPVYPDFEVGSCNCLYLLVLSRHVASVTANFLSSHEHVY